MGQSCPPLTVTLPVTPVCLPVSDNTGNYRVDKSYRELQASSPSETINPLGTSDTYTCCIRAVKMLKNLCLFPTVKISLFN